MTGSRRGAMVPKRLTVLRILLTGGDKLRAAPASDIPFALVNNNFFDLGGHSLLLARVHAERRRQPGTDLS